MRGDGRIFKRSSTPFYWCAYYLRGQEYRESTGETDEQKATKYLRRRLKEVGADQVGLHSFLGPKQEKVSVNEILDDLVAKYKQSGKLGSREVSPQMESHLKRVREYFGEKRAMTIRESHILDFVAKLRGEGKQNATINRSLQLLSQAYKIATSGSSPKLLRKPTISKLDESGNVRTGKFSPQEADMIFASLPEYMVDVARFAYQTGRRSGEILKYTWDRVDGNAIRVAAATAKNRTADRITVTPEDEEILARRRARRVPGCDLIFHHNGRPIVTYDKCWHTACVINGLGKFYCRDCRGENGEYISVLDAERKCPNCGKKWSGKKGLLPKYIGKIFHDFRRTASYEMRKSGNSPEDCMKRTGHRTAAMFKRYSDLFSEEEESARQLQVQERRKAWREAQESNLVVMPKVALQ